MLFKKNNKVGIIDKWGHAITQTEFDGYCSCSGHESWNDSVHEDKPTKAIGILLKDRTFYAVYRNANILQANQIREIKSPFLFKDIQANAYRIEDYCISNNDKDKVFGYIVYSSDNSWYSFFNQEGQIIGGGEEFVLNNEGTLSLKRENTWFEYTGNIIKEMNERKTYEFDLGEEHGGKQICRADDFSDEVIDLSSFLPINGGEHTYMLVGEISNNNKVKMVSNDSNKKQIVEKQKYIDNSQGGVIRTPTPIQRPQTCGICGGTGRCSECGGSGISHFAHDHICGACNGNGKCTTCAGKGISGYITEYVY